MRKGPHEVSVVCDLIGKRALCATLGKDAATRSVWVEALGAHNGHPRAITAVVHRLAAHRGLETMNSAENKPKEWDSVNRVRENRLHGLTRGGQRAG